METQEYWDINNITAQKLNSRLEAIQSFEGSSIDQTMREINLLKDKIIDARKGRERESKQLEHDITDVQNRVNGASKREAEEWRKICEKLRLECITQEENTLKNMKKIRGQRQKSRAQILEEFRSEIPELKRRIILAQDYMKNAEEAEDSLREQVQKLKEALESTQRERQRAEVEFQKIVHQATQRLDNLIQLEREEREEGEKQMLKRIALIKQELEYS
eukprot:TRINITY_DN3520_c0_g1_i3.p2 TRINITY_DN3520_c0_g1~~TRINITY_DN3520_c0_g1_i3.p2  ORF type:complete len:219 (+),score=52.89 TRINITY_DN3520_c0_g1_i3:92-748(+)